MDNEGIRADSRKPRWNASTCARRTRCSRPRTSRAATSRRSSLAREIERNPDLLLVGQPTRGVDIGAIEFIHKRIIALRDAGKAILLVSVELDEIMSMSDRIAVMFDGRIMGERDPAADEPARAGPPDGRDHRRLGRPPDGRGRLMDRETLDAEDAAWVDVFVIPLISLIIAFAISALVILAIGENPIDAVRVMVTGALGSTYGWGYTLYYATNFMFTGLAFAVAFHAGLFNIGGEGQAALGGLGVALCLPDVPLAALDDGASGRDAGRRALRRGLGRDPGLSAGRARQPHRHHDDHVQPDRRVAAELHARQRPAPAGPDGPGEREFPARHASAHASGSRGLLRPEPVPRRARERHASSWRSSPACSSGS
jgi:hypothetical protein